MKKCTYIIVLLLFSNLLYTKDFPDTYRHRFLKPDKQFALLSCKLDAFHYGLSLLKNNPLSVSNLYEKLPVNNNLFLKKNNDNTYSISNPLIKSPGSIYGQQARFDKNNNLFLLYKNKLIYSIWNNENMLDNNQLFDIYKKNICFGIDNRLIARTFRPYLSTINITMEFFDVEEMSKEDIKKEFARIIYNGGVIICNGIVKEYKNPRTYSFEIIETGEEYLWKEASHAFTLIGYDLKKNIFYAADNYGELKSPYNPCFYEISFDELYDEITLLSKKYLDYSYVLFPADKNLMPEVKELFIIDEKG